MGPPGHQNRLARESSPYLRQHAGNPVDWYPWGEEALGRARAEGRPIFLSIGYAACHWCHVMERESFEDAAIAEVLNSRFVAIKVDREERPDVDATYMNAVQAMTGSGGWPLSVFLTPEGEPFFGGTYFPPERRYGRPSFSDVLAAVTEAWVERRGEIERSGRSLSARLRDMSRREGRATLDVDRALRQALNGLSLDYDPRWGGFGQAPKFPTPSRLFFLLSMVDVDPTARQILTGTLDGMASGGMWDWVGGGFHRYSVDEMWLVPHFEKMLYDNALLARAYAAAGVALGRGDWLHIARQTADAMLREMQGPEGGFNSSTDADSEGEEGMFFTWTEAEARAALPAADAELAIDLFALGTPNFDGGRCVLRPRWSLRETAEKLGRTDEEAEARLARIRELLRQARASRVPPARDDKRLAGWNGMAIWALAYLGSALEEQRYLDAARRAADFVLREMVRPDGRIVRSWLDGATSGAETLEDVAWVVAGLVELFQADGELRWLTAALLVADGRLQHYRDASGAVFETPDDGETLIARPRTPTDGATPASVAVLADALMRLAALTGRGDLRAAAESAAENESAVVARVPEACLSLLAAADALRRPPREVVIVGEPSSESTHALLRAARSSPRPPTIVVAAAPPVASPLVAAVPLFSGREDCPGGVALAYVCTGGACDLPTSDPRALSQRLCEAL